jgi:hypothetical protein
VGLFPGFWRTRIAAVGETGLLDNWVFLGYRGEGRNMDVRSRCDSSHPPARQKNDVGFDPGCWRTGTGWNAGQLKVDKVCWTNPPLSGPNRARTPKLFPRSRRARSLAEASRPHMVTIRHTTDVLCAAKPMGDCRLGPFRNDFGFHPSAFDVPIRDGCSRKGKRPLFRRRRAPMIVFASASPVLALTTLHRQQLAGLLFKSLSVVAAGGRFRRASAA